MLNRQFLSRSKQALIAAAGSARNPRFAAVRRHGRGLLSPGQYAAIYKTVKAAPDLDVIDIGSAGGATAVSAALAKRDAGSERVVIAVEKCEGGSRSSYGGYDENRAFLENNFRHFGVDNRVRLFPHYLTLDNAPDLLGLLTGETIAGFIHDADGRIDRDFQLLGPRIAEGGFVIIDDVTDTVKYRPISVRYPFGGTKNITTWRLLEYFDELALFTLTRRMGPVVFGHIQAGADFSRIDNEKCQSIVDGVLREHAEATETA